MVDQVIKGKIIHRAVPYKIYNGRDWRCVAASLYTVRPRPGEGGQRLLIDGRHSEGQA